MKFKAGAAGWQVRKKARRGFRGYPVATVAFYEPTDEFATKVVVGIAASEDSDPDPLRDRFTHEPIE